MKAIKTRVFILCVSLLIFFLLPWNFSVSHSMAAELNVPSAFSTIQAAIDASSDGDTIWVDSGVYSENIVISSKSLHLRSMNGYRNTHINSIGTTILIDNCSDYVTVEGFRITAESENDYQHATCIQANYSKIKVLQNVLHSSSDKTPNNKYSSAQGVRLNNCNESIISNNLIDCYFIVEGSYYASAIGIYVDNSDSIIAGNKIIAISEGLYKGAHSPASGIYHRQGSDSIIYNNKIIAISVSNGSGIDNNGNLKVYNNTIFASSTLPDDFMGAGIRSAGWPPPSPPWPPFPPPVEEENSITIYNNILYGDGSRSVGLFVLNQNAIADYNCSYNHGGPWEDDIYNILPGENNIHQDPLLSDFSNNDFSLSTDSPCIDAGTNDVLAAINSTDIEGKIRPLDGDDNGISICDIGAHEADNPSTTELCDGVDNDSDGLTDEGFDSDDDNFTTCAGDCDDDNPAINPDAQEECDEVDNDCDGMIDEDCLSASADENNDNTQGEFPSCFITCSKNTYVNRQAEKQRGKKNS